MVMGYVYIFSSDDFISKGKFKVGKTKDPKSRLGNMTTSCLGGKYLFIEACRNMDKVELFIHKDLKGKGKHIDKEWFLFDNTSVAISYVKERINRYDDEQGEKPNVYNLKDVSQQSSTSTLSTKTKLDKNIAERDRLKSKMEKITFKYKDDEAKLKDKIEQIQKILKEKRKVFMEKERETNKQMKDVERKVQEEKMLSLGEQTAKAISGSSVDIFKVMKIFNF